MTGRYGLLLQLLSATGIMSLLNTGQYLARGSGKRARSTSLLKQAFSVAILVYVVTHAIRFASSVVKRALPS